MADKAGDDKRNPDDLRRAVRTWKAEVRRAEADLHRAIKKRHTTDYFDTIRLKVDRLEEIDRRFREPTVSRTELDVPLWDRLLVMWGQFGEPLALALFLIIFIVGVAVGVAF